jgi:hypothetical protein
VLTSASKHEIRQHTRALFPMITPRTNTKKPESTVRCWWTHMPFNPSPNPAQALPIWNSRGIPLLIELPKTRPVAGSHPTQWIFTWSCWRTFLLHVCVRCSALCVCGGGGGGGRGFF